MPPAWSAVRAGQPGGVLEDGRDLPTVAGMPERSTFDWTELDQATLDSRS
jgi:hypothetical protein